MQRCIPVDVLFKDIHRLYINERVVLGCCVDFMELKLQHAALKFGIVRLFYGTVLHFRS
jgi:hypothetical protein